jgi:L-alanine-DL-glutamate epimerase-like enolase superfamily enzyme
MLGADQEGAMRIAGIESMVVEVPLKEPVTGVHGVTSVQKSVLVRVRSDDGVEGWGDVDPTPGYTLESVDDIAAGVARIAEALLGSDPFNVQRALAVMDATASEAFEAKAAVEMALIEIIKREAADIVKVKAMKQGGLLRTRSMIDCAAAAGLRVVFGHGFGLTLSTLAEATLAATSAAVLPGCEAVGPLKMSADVVADPVDLAHGVVKLPGTPGLGAAVDPAALARYRRSGT